MPSLMNSPSRTYEVSIVRSCQCLGISLPGSILSRTTAGPRDWSLFNTLTVIVPLVLGNGAAIASISEVWTVRVKLIEVSLLSVSCGSYFVTVSTGMRSCRLPWRCRADGGNRAQDHIRDGL